MNELTEKARRIFINDRYATDLTGIEIDLVDEKHTVCSLSISDKHRNARGAVMGGVLFTLADYTFAISSHTQTMAENMDTHDITLQWVSESSYINFLASPKGTTLKATSHLVKSGRSRCLYQIDIEDGTGRLVATVTTNGARIQN